jgi:hypothetical protein
VALTPSADDDHLLEAYGVFAAEARDIKPDYSLAGPILPTIAEGDRGGAPW